MRTLRERGKQAWGFDHSAWAIDHAEESTKPFVRLAGVEEAEFDREFDVLVSFFLLESLTEDQAVEFLKRMRSRIRQALLAVVLTREDEERKSPEVEHDRDLSHITLRSKMWWHELILRADWRQDSLHKIAARGLQRHPLPRRMGWDLFIFSPS